MAAFCHDSEPGRIISRLGRRDAQVDSDWFMFAVDPYYDKRTGYLFGVNPAGSIIDQALSNDVNERRLLGRRLGMEGRGQRQTAGPWR